jgi:hypothetical protein
MTFSLLGIDWIPKDKLGGFWIGSIKFWEKDFHSALFEIYYNDGEWVFDCCYYKLIKEMGNE